MSAGCTDQSRLVVDLADSGVRNRNAYEVDAVGPRIALDATRLTLVTFGDASSDVSDPIRVSLRIDNDRIWTSENDVAIGIGGDGDLAPLEDLGKLTDRLGMIDRRRSVPDSASSASDHCDG